MVLFVGFDPGVCYTSPGGYAAIDEHGFVVALNDMPINVVRVPSKLNKGKFRSRSSLDLPAFVSQLDSLYIVRHQNIRTIYTAIEEQAIFGGDSRQSGGVIMRHLGQIEGVLAGFGASYQLIGPKDWQKEYGLSGDKEAHLAVARRLFPDMGDNLKLKKNHGRADALLIAEYLRRTTTDGQTEQNVANIGDEF